MDLTRIKLIVTDMDGTLLNSSGKLSEKFPSLLKEIRKKDIRVVVASGRQYFSLKKIFAEVKDELIFIAENGSLVMEGDERKHMQPMQREQALEILHAIREIGGKYLILCGRKSAYIERTDPEFMEPFLNHYDTYEVVEDLSEVTGDDFLKVTVCDLSGAEKNTFPHVQEFRERFQVKLSGKIWVDFTHRLAQKGNALEKIQDIYGVSPEETMAFGDYFNDIELFERAKYSFAMENAHEEVKERARFLTKSNDEYGVEVILEDLLKNR